MSEHQWRQEPDEGRPATKHEFDMITRALDRLNSQKNMLGIFTIINLKTGEYVTGQTLMEANDRFQSSFSDVRGFAHRVGEPLYEPLFL